MEIFKPLSWSVFALVLLLVAFSEEAGFHPWHHHHHTIGDIGVQARGEGNKLQVRKWQDRRLGEYSERKFIRDKWGITFKFHELNNDNVISRDDMAVQQDAFINSYDLEGLEADSAKQLILAHWSCLTLNKLDTRLSEKQLVKLVMQSYRKSKTQTREHFHHCADLLAGVVDQNQDGFLALSELNIYYKSVNHGDKKLAEEKYRLICQYTEKPCPMDRAVHYWFEILIGDDQEFYEMLNEAHENVGQPLEELVE